MKHLHSLECFPDSYGLRLSIPYSLGLLSELEFPGSWNALDFLITFPLLYLFFSLIMVSIVSYKMAFSSYLFLLLLSLQPFSGWDQIHFFQGLTKLFTLWSSGCNHGSYVFFIDLPPRLYVSLVFSFILLPPLSGLPLSNAYYPILLLMLPSRLAYVQSVAFLYFFSTIPSYVNSSISMHSNMFTAFLKGISKSKPCR